jgi:hypothetical protein
MRLSTEALVCVDRLPLKEPVEVAMLMVAPLTTGPALGGGDTTVYRKAGREPVSFNSPKVDP